MDLLTERDRRHLPSAACWILGLTAVLLAVGLASCLGLGGRPTMPTFPHDVHVQGMRLACTFCHVTVRSADMPSMPPPELCARCHDDLEPTEPDWLQTYYLDAGRYRRASPADLHPDVIYRHRDHAGTANLDCIECHTDIADLHYIPLRKTSWKSKCMDCHRDNGLDNSDCSGCHREIDRDWQPPNHHLAWDVHHGEAVRSGDPASANRCELCHDQSSSCQNCHRNNPPRDHNHSFRLRTHGIRAAMDRSRCYTCHRTDTCEQCHGETRPLSHRGGFGATAQRHCNSCHFPLGDNGCVVCHKSTPSHQTATPLPLTHTPSMNCRQCHGNGQPLPHPDGGHACTICHR